MNTHRTHLIHQLKNRQIPASAKPCFVRSDLAKTFALALASSAGVLAMCLPFGTHAETIIVPSGSIVTIQDGVDAAAPGDTIQVLPGHYTENVTVTTPSIKLLAKTETGPVRVFSFFIQADNVEIEGFQVAQVAFLGSGDRGILVDRSVGVHISHNTVSNIFEGIRVSSSSDVCIDHNTVDTPVASAIVVGHSSGTDVHHNVAISHEGASISVSGSSGTHVHHNTARAAGFIAGGIDVLSSSDGQIDHNTVVSVSGVFGGIFVDGDSCGNVFNANSVEGFSFSSHSFALYSEDNPAAPCNRYKNNEAATAFPSLEFWDAE